MKTCVYALKNAEPFPQRTAHCCHITTPPNLHPKPGNQIPPNGQRKLGQMKNNADASATASRPTGPAKVCYLFYKAALFFEHVAPRRQEENCVFLWHGPRSETKLWHEKFVGPRSRGVRKQGCGMKTSWTRGHDFGSRPPVVMNLQQKP